jgi:hypothetical protein
MSDHDPLDALRDAWNELSPPAPDHDAATDALVDDLRAAWAALEAPVSDPRDLRIALRRRERARRWRDRSTLVAAASLLVALVLVARGDWTADRHGEDQIAVGGTEPHDEPLEQPPTPAPDSRVHPLGGEVRARALDDGTLELKHGRVRLLLGGRSTTNIHPQESAASPAVNAEEETK